MVTRVRSRGPERRRQHLLVKWCPGAGPPAFAESRPWFRPLPSHNFIPNVDRLPSQPIGAVSSVDDGRPMASIFPVNG